MVSLLRLQKLVILGVLGSILGVLLLFGGGTQNNAPNLLRVTFLNVGQGDAIFIETPDGVQLLVDGGPDGSVAGQLAQVMSWHDRTIDVVLGTHPDKDHIGGLIDVLEQYTVGTLVTTENRGESFVATAYQEALLAESARVYMARAGQVYQLGASTTLTIFSPASDPSMLESNTASIVAQLRYGTIEFMLTGDAPSSIEEYIVRTYGSVVQSEVLKLGHHGSKTSTSLEFLTAVAPQYAVVSAAADNSYGHPHAEVMTMVQQFGSTIKETKNGAVTFVSDGTAVWVE